MQTIKIGKGQSLLKTKLALVATLLILLVTGCGTTSLVLKPSEESQAEVAGYKSLVVQTSTDGAAISDGVQNRIRDFIKAEISAQCSNRFESISIKNGNPRDLILLVKFTKYDEGNRFARAMLAGLGSMKIHAEIEVKNPASGATYCKGEAGKTFAWGGLYGAMTGIEDVEKDFAKEVAKGFAGMLGIKQSE